MIENYTHTTEQIPLYIYEAGVPTLAADPTPTVEAEDFNTGEAVTVSSVTEDIDHYYVTLDPSETATPRVVLVTWTYTVDGTEITKEDVVEIATPIVEYHEVLEAYPQFGPTGAAPKTYTQIKSMERRVRNAIEAYTGQTFADVGLQTFKVMGTGSNYLHLPERIYGLESVSSPHEALYGTFPRFSNGNIFGVNEDGILIDPSGELIYDEFDNPLKSWTEGQPIFYDDGTEIENVTYETVDYVSWDIESPYFIYRPSIGNTERLIIRGPMFRNNVVYTVTARVGWPYVPGPVSQAAMILIGDYFDPDHEFYAKGLSDVKSADFSYKYAHDPYSTTGNTTADRFLSQYINLGVHVF